MRAAFPKLFAVGTKYIIDIFDEEVEVTEKVDGSQFGFGKFDGQVMCRSKGQVQHLEAPDKMFKEGVEYVKSIADRLPEGVMFYSEYLQRPRHSTLAYDRIPKNHIAIFGVQYADSSFETDFEKVKEWAEKLEVDHVPLLFKGKITRPEDLLNSLKIVSFLGGQEVEGVVVKRYQPWLFGDQVFPLKGGKFVSEKFKEVHRKDWSRENTGGGKWDTFKQGYRTEARWHKAIQHLKEQGILEESPRDIGKLIKEVQTDVVAEEKEIIKDFLWKLWGSEVLKVATSGLPEWYKEQLLKKSFEEGLTSEPVQD